MDQVKVVDAGAQLIVSGPSRAVVDAAVEALVAQGVRVVSAAAQLGSRWVATCAKPEPAEGTAGVAGQDFQLTTDEALLRRVKISDAGEHLMITAAEKNAVAAALEALARRGQRVLAPPAPMGNSWVAACEKAEAIANRCTVERMGFQVVVRGPGRAAVEAKVSDLVGRGAKLEGSIEHVGGEWVAVCDAGEVTGIMHIREAPP
jgi:hypothetical protein